MPGAIIAVLVCVWYYRTADQIKLNPLPWIVGGLILYYGTKYGWTYGVIKPLLGKSMASPFINDITGAAAGVIVAAVFRAKVMLKQKPLE